MCIGKHASVGSDKQEDVSKQCKISSTVEKRSCEDTQNLWHQRFREVPAMVPLIGPQPKVANVAQ